MPRFGRMIAVILAFSLLVSLVSWQVWMASVHELHRQPASRADQSDVGEVKPKTAEERIALYTEVLAWFTGLLAVVSSGQGYFLYRADKTTRITADAALLSAGAARDTANAVVVQMRAYASVTAARIHGFEGDGPLRLHIRIANRGQTPAYDLTHEHGFTIREASANRFRGDLWPPERDPPLSKGTLAPGTITDAFIHMPPLRPDGKDAVREGTHGLFAYGEIRYKDAFGKLRFSTYRFMYGGGAPLTDDQFVICEEGNTES
jgi:hypothetical protein